jgi:hypothetical protein
MITDPTPERRSNDKQLDQIHKAVRMLLDSESREESNWRFEKRVSVGNLLTGVGMLILLLGAWATMDKRVVILERSSEYQAKVDERQDHNADIARAEVKAELEKISIKLDRLADRATDLYPKAR